MTENYAVIGNPVAHSRSPEIHRLFAHATAQDMVYERLLSPLDKFGVTLKAFAASGGKGCNVTVPFKFEAFSIACSHTPRAVLAQAANTLTWSAQKGAWIADNTDGVGLLRDITLNAATLVARRRILLLGAGGASAGILGPLIEAMPAKIVLANRTLQKAEVLVQRHAAWASHHQVMLHASDLQDDAFWARQDSHFDIVINGTSSSLNGEPSPVGSSVLRPGSLAIDLMYGPAAQPFLQWAHSHGAQTRDGLGMLVEQAAESFWQWRGVRPETAAVIEAMRVV